MLVMMKVTQGNSNEKKKEKKRKKKKILTCQYHPHCRVAPLFCSQQQTEELTIETLDTLKNGRKGRKPAKKKTN
jgi:hypothetical protein